MEECVFLPACGGNPTIQKIYRIYRLRRQAGEKKKISKIYRISAQRGEKKTGFLDYATGGRLKKNLHPDVNICQKIAFNIVEGHFLHI